MIQPTEAYLQPESLYETNNTELAACLATLGFELLDGGGMHLVGDGISAPGGVVTWRFSSRSADGKYTLPYVLTRWTDVAWLNDPTNDDPLAYIITAFHNKRRLLDQVKQSVPIAIARQGKRFAFYRTDASLAHQDSVARFLAGYRA